jgi:hypothetical protein
VPETHGGRLVSSAISASTRGAIAPQGHPITFKKSAEPPIDHAGLSRTVRRAIRRA